MTNLIAMTLQELKAVADHNLDCASDHLNAMLDEISVALANETPLALEAIDENLAAVAAHAGRVLEIARVLRAEGLRQTAEQEDDE